MLVLLLLVPTGAAAQPHDNEADNARAFADIGVRATAAIDAVTAATEGRPDAPSTCPASGRVRGKARKRAISKVYAAHWIARYSRATLPAISQAVDELDAVHTSDEALRSGRTAWRRVERAYTDFGSLRPVRFCSVVRDYVRADFRPPPAMRRATEMYGRQMGWDTTDIDARLGRAVERLIELGVPPADADAFDGEIDGASDAQ